LTAVVFAEDGIALARVGRHGDQPPRLLSCVFQPWGDDRAGTLRALIDAQHLRKTRCATLMGDGDYQLMLVDALQVQADEMRDAIRWRIKDLLDFSVDEAIIDLFEIPDQGRNRPQQVYVVAAHIAKVRERIETVGKAGLKLEAIDIEELALRNLTTMMEEDAHGVALLWLSGSYGLILVTFGGELYLSRRIEIGSDALFSAAQQGDPENGEIDTELADLIDQVTLEVQRSLDYYDSHFEQPPVACVIVAPTVPDLPFLAPRLGTALAAPVRLLDLAGLFGTDALPEPEQQAHCLTAIGAALRG
jgi:MSHA biogenesis protein MshI